MEFIWVLTLLGVFISIYNISEDYKKRNLKYRLNNFEWIVLILFISLSLIVLILATPFKFLTHYLIDKTLLDILVFIPFFDYIFPFINSYIPEMLNIELLTLSFHEVFIFVYCLILGGLFTIIINSKKIHKENLFLRNVEDMYLKDNLDAVLSDLTEYNSELKLKNKKYLKLKDKCDESKKSKASKLLRYLRDKFKISRNNKLFKYLLFGKNCRNLEKLNKKNKILNMIVIRIINDQNFVKTLFTKNHILAVDILSFDFLEEKDKIWKNYVKYLLKNKESILYDEIYSDTRRFYEDSPKPTPLLDIFKNLDLYLKIRAWDPVCQEVTKYLENQKTKHMNDIENKKFREPMEYEEYLWISPIYIGICFLNRIMKNSLELGYHQTDMGQVWYTWYLKDILENISYGYEDLSEYNGRTAETPLLRYEYYIDLIFDNYSSWILHENNFKDLEKGGESKYYYMLNFTIWTFTDAVKMVLNSNLRKEFKQCVIDKYIETFLKLNFFKATESEEYKTAKKSISEIFLNNLSKLAKSSYHNDVLTISLLREALVNSDLKYKIIEYGGQYKVLKNILIEHEEEITLNCTKFNYYLSLPEFEYLIDN